MPIFVLGDDDPISKLSLYVRVLVDIRRDPIVCASSLHKSNREKHWLSAPTLQYVYNTGLLTFLNTFPGPKLIATGSIS